MKQTVHSLFHGRYEVVRTLSSSSESLTTLAQDVQTGEHVVIKAVYTERLSVGMQLRLEHHGARLLGADNPWVAQLLDTRRSDDALYFVAEYIEGATLAERLADGPLPLTQALDLAACLFGGLKFLHDRGVYHRGITPANIRLPDEGVFARLMDIGSTLSFQYESANSQDALDIASFLSPEQAGTIDQDVAAPANLYSAGIILFLSLANRTPFDGKNVGDILFAHMTAPVPELSRLGIAVPRVVDEILQRLMHKDPQDRYQTADAVLADVDLVRQALQRGERDPQIVIGSADHRRTLTEPSFVARQRELAHIDRHLQDVLLGKGRFLSLEGESGQGKSRLLVEFARRAARKGCWVLRGQAAHEVAPGPMQLLNGIMDGILAESRTDRLLADRLKDELGNQGAILAAAIPRLAPVLGSDATPQVAEQLQEGVFLHALVQLLDALGSADRPALLLLDDCQWADELTIKLLSRWALERQVNASRRSSWLIVVTAFRTEEVESLHPLRELSPSEHLRLTPLAADDIRSLVESMAGALPADAVQLIVDGSDGSPFMASALLRGLVESGVLMPHPTGWTLDQSNRSRFQSSDYAASLLTERIELLKDHAVELLTIGAVLGKQFSLETAASVSAFDGPQVIDAVDEARVRHLVWLRPDESQCEFVHDRIREVLLRRLSAAERQAIHLRAARHLESHGAASPADIAFHFDAAGWSQLALPYALKAAEQLRKQHALEMAEQQYRIAEGAARSAGQRCAYRIASGLGDVQMLRGRYEEAQQAFIKAAENAAGSYEASAVLGKLAELAFKRGNIAQAIRDFEHALAALGKFVPRHWLSVHILVAWETFVQALHTCWPGIFVHRCKRLPTDKERLSLRLFSGLAHGYWYARGKANSFWAHLRGMNLAERYLATPELAQAYSEHAPGMTLLPLFARATRYANKSLAIRKESGDLWGQAQSLHYHGCALYAASDFTPCIEKCREAIRLMERLGDYWQVHIARYQVAAALYHLGDLDAALRESRLNYESGIRLGDEQASSLILDVWARASAGNIPPEILDRERSRSPDDAQTSSQVLLARGICLWYSRDYLAAAEAIEQAIRIAEQSGVRNAYTLPNYAWLATARRSAAETMSDKTPFARDQQLQCAVVAARAGIRSSRLCRNDLPRALREYAMALAMQGKTDRVRQLLDKSLRIAEEIKDRYEYAQTLIARGQLGMELGWPQSSGLVSQGERLVASLWPQANEKDEHGERSHPISATLSLADRFDTVLDSGRNIAGAIYESAIYDTARSAALRLLRGEKCLVLEVENSADGLQFRPVAGDLDTSVQLDLVKHATMTQSVVIGDDLALSSSCDLAGGGSVVCMPIVARHRPAACLYVVHRRIRGLFGKDERRLAGFVTAIAGAALENAEGFQQLQNLNRTLEQRVEERTAAAEAASRAKSQFLATMSHEIRTPMNGILGMTELALRTPLTQTQQNYLQTVKQSGEALLTLLNDVLDLSKIEAGKMELEQIAFQLRDMVAESVSLLAPAAAGKGIELTYRVDPAAAEQVAGDPNRLRQILVNLVGNAVKFTDSGEIHVEVVVSPREGSEHQLHFSVKDTGTGIPADKLGSIFEAFRQSDSSTTRKYGGTGLGLSISYELVKLMGGHIWVESVLTRGSTFHFVIPCHPVAVATASDRCPACEGREVLLISDHPTNRMVFAEMLRRHGLIVRINTRKAVAEGRPGNEQLMVADFTSRDTADDVAWVCEWARRRECPWVALVPADGSATQLQSATEFVLMKPVKESQLVQCLQSALSGRAASETTDWHNSSSALPPLTILLADDSIVNQEVGRGLLELLGHSVTTVENGQEAVAAVQAGSFDVVLMDLEMPEMDGLEAARAIRAWERSAQRVATPIIAMTAHTLDNCTERFGDLVMDGHVPKPIQPEVLVKALEDAWASIRSSELVSAH